MANKLQRIWLRLRFPGWLCSPCGPDESADWMATRKTPLHQPRRRQLNDVYADTCKQLARQLKRQNTVDDIYRRDPR
jgi:hypothetical protein